MSTPARLIAFAGLLALVFAGAVLAGGASGVDRSTETAATAQEQPMDGHGGGEAAQPAGGALTPGLAVSQGDTTLQLATTSFPRGRERTLRFRLVDGSGRPVTRFATEHTKRMHLIVVRRDTQGFQHLHPTMAADGTWSTPLRLDASGSYRVFADFRREGGAKTTLAADLLVDGDADYAPLPAPATTSRPDPGYEVRLDAGHPKAGAEARLRFTVLRDGEPVRTEPYLGAGGHLVALRDGDLAYLHTHPDEAAGDDVVSFMSELPTAGRYRLFFQFQHDGRVRTAAYTLEVTR
jgi:hypothetical protein